MPCRASAGRVAVEATVIGIDGRQAGAQPATGQPASDAAAPWPVMVGDPVRVRSCASHQHQAAYCSFTGLTC